MGRCDFCTWVRGQVEATTVIVDARDPAYLVMEVCWYTGRVVVLREDVD